MVRISSIKNLHSLNNVVWIQFIFVYTLVFHSDYYNFPSKAKSCVNYDMPN